MSKPKCLFFFALLGIVVLANAQTENTGLIYTQKEVYNRTGLSAACFYKGILPVKIDLSDGLPAVGNQYRQNSCVGWALGYACRTYYNFKQEKISGSAAKNNTASSKIISPAFIYNLLNNGKNKGISIDRALHLLIDVGACSYQTMPYNKLDWKTVPGQKEINEAARFRIDTFKKIDLGYAVANLKAELIAHNPVICAAQFDEHYFIYGYNTRQPFYVWNKFNPSNSEIGHAIVLVGYDDSLYAFKFINSWGTTWGNSGYGWLSYTLAPSVLREAYIIMPKKNEPKPHRNIRPAILPENKITPPPPNFFHPEEIYKAEQIQEIWKDFMKMTRDTSSGILITEVRIRKDTVFAADLIILNGYAAIRNFNCDKYKVVIQFFHSDRSGEKGAPVMSKDTSYQLANLQVAGECRTNYLQYDNTDWDMWETQIPVSAFDIPKGKQGEIYYEPEVSDLLAEPVLFVDDFPLLIGKPFLLQVRY